MGKKPHPDYNLADWVLSRFTDEEMKKLSDVDKKHLRGCGAYGAGQDKRGYEQVQFKHIFSENSKMNIFYEMASVLAFIKM